MKKGRRSEELEYVREYKCRVLAFGLQRNSILYSSSTRSFVVAEEIDYERKKTAATARQAHSQTRI